MGSISAVECLIQLLTLLKKGRGIRGRQKAVGRKPVSKPDFNLNGLLHSTRCLLPPASHGFFFFFSSAAGDGSFLPTSIIWFALSATRSKAEISSGSLT